MRRDLSDARRANTSSVDRNDGGFRVGGRLLRDFVVHGAAKILGACLRAQRARPLVSTVRQVVVAVAPGSSGPVKADSVCQSVALAGGMWQKPDPARGRWRDATRREPAPDATDGRTDSDPGPLPLG